MLMLSFFWLLLGALIGAVANAARLRPAPGRQGWLVMLGIGALAALLGGWFGVLLLGKYIATAVALWVAVFGVAVVPWLAGLHRRDRVQTGMDGGR